MNIFLLPKFISTGIWLPVFAAASGPRVKTQPGIVEGKTGRFDGLIHST